MGYKQHRHGAHNPYLYLAISGLGKFCTFYKAFFKGTVAQGLNGIKKRHDRMRLRYLIVHRNIESITSHRGGGGAPPRAGGGGVGWWWRGLVWGG
jgi:hypothetical protein